MQFIENKCYSKANPMSGFMTSTENLLRTICNQGLAGLKLLQKHKFRVFKLHWFHENWWKTNSKPAVVRFLVRLAEVNFQHVCMDFSKTVWGMYVAKSTSPFFVDHFLTTVSVDVQGEFTRFESSFRVATTFISVLFWISCMDHNLSTQSLTRLIFRF